MAGDIFLLELRLREMGRPPLDESWTRVLCLFCLEVFTYRQSLSTQRQSLY